MVRGRTGAADGPVVVGLDGSCADNRLLAAAFEHADRRGCDVVAIHALATPAGPWSAGPRPRERADLLWELTDDVQRWHEKYPSVPATARVPAGDPASVLLDASGEAQLLVLGSRGHGPASALLAGSVTHRLLYHAACPLLVVRTGRDGRP
ncbi:universal stress protein [Dactylosporangium sp. CA-233914]|uniref:universal stress protein n=1 Tax=Dactylosporangium sp. CA-233914 TaxID=3239934 RepID=UPI003D8E37F7